MATISLCLFSLLLDAASVTLSLIHILNDRLKSPVRCLFQEDAVQLSCETAIGGASDRFSIQNNGDELEIGFNNRYLLDALRASETDEVKIQLNGSLSPMKIVPKEGDHFLFLVLPVRLKLSLIHI